MCSQQLPKYNNDTHVTEHCSESQDTTLEAWHVIKGHSRVLLNSASLLKSRVELNDRSPARLNEAMREPVQACGSV